MATVTAGAPGRAEPKRRVCCVYHCSTCGRHFVSLEAFDLHRPKRSCVDPRTVVTEKDRTTLAEKATDAVCDIGHDEEMHGVTVWQTRAAQLAGRRPA